MKLNVFTDYACHFCYISHVMCRKIEKENGYHFQPFYMEIHADLPSQGADSFYLFPGKKKERLNERLKTLGKPYGIEPRIGEHLYSSKKAITLRAYLARHIPDIVPEYDDRIYPLYQVELKDIGSDEVLQGVLDQLRIRIPLLEMLDDPETNEKRKQDRCYADLNMIHTTPSFQIGKKIYKGVQEEEKLLELCRIELSQ